MSRVYRWLTVELLRTADRLWRDHYVQGLVRSGIGRELLALDAKAAPEAVLAELDRYGPADVARWLRGSGKLVGGPKHLVRYANRTAHLLGRDPMVHAVMTHGMRRQLEAAGVDWEYETQVSACLFAMQPSDLVRWFCNAYPEKASC